MIINFTKRRTVRQIAFIVLCIVSLFWKQISSVYEFDNSNSLMPLSQLLNIVLGSNYILSVAIKSLLLLVCIFTYMAILSIYNLLPNKKSRAIVLFLSIISVVTNGQNLATVCFALLFILLAIYQLIHMHNLRGTKASIFNSAFYIVIASFFMPPAIIIILSVFFCIWLFSLIDPKHLIAIFLGVITPFILCFSFYHLILHEAPHFFELIKSNFSSLVLLQPSYGNLQLYFICFITLATTFTAIQVISKETKKIIYRKANQIFCFVFIIAVVVAIVAFCTDYSAAAILSIPSSYLIIRYLQLTSRKWLAKILCYAIFGAALIYSFFI